MMSCAERDRNRAIRTIVESKRTNRYYTIIEFTYTIYGRDVLMPFLLQ